MVKGDNRQYQLIIRR